MPPRLFTLGQLSLAGSDFRREKPLLLLAYLCVQGPQVRRNVARLFWPGAADPMNSLSVAVAQLRRAAPDLIEASETQVLTRLTDDAAAFRSALQGAELEVAGALYRGPFLATLTLGDLSEELEEWIMTTREGLADAYRSALLTAARGSAEAQAAAELSARAFRVVGTTPPLPEQLREGYRWLSAAQHPDAERVRQEAQELGLKLAAPEPAAPLLGRERELARLTGLKAGETLWVSGAAKLGKSALLRAAAQQGTLLPGRSGRPFQTLAGLVEGARFLPASSEGWLGLLRDHSGLLLLDDWELADPESRRVLLALAHSHAGPPLVISSRARSALGSHSGFHELSLRPLPQEVLGDALYAQTAGHPALLAAVQRSEPLSEPVAALLSPLSPRARQLLICLCLHAEVGAADRQVVSAALQLSADDMTETLETLSRAGWLQEGQPVPLAALRSWLATQPVQEAEVLTLLVPHLKSERAFPLYLRAHDLSGSSDLPGFQEALQAHSRRLLDRGQDHRAEELLARHARGPAAQLLHARALDGLGRYPDALKVLDALPSTPPVQALRGRVLFRLGEIAAARIAAQQALSGDLETRAQAYNLLGALALAAREYTQARSAFERAVGLFLLQGDELARLNALCSQAVAMTELGQDISAVLHDISRLSERLEHPPTLLNIGWLLERQGHLPAALTLYGRAATLAEALRQSATAASAWNNVGVIHQKEGRSEAAAQAYQTAIGHAQQTGEIRTLAMVLGNLAELQDSLPLIEEALSLLQNAGQDDLAAYFEEQRQAFMARSGAL